MLPNRELFLSERLRNKILLVFQGDQWQHLRDKHFSCISHPLAVNAAPTFWLMGTGRSSSSLADETVLSTGFILSAGFVGAAVLPCEVLACFGTVGFGAVFPWDNGSIFAGAAWTESDAAGVGFTGDGTAWEDFGGVFVWTRYEQSEIRQIPQQHNSFAQTVIKGRKFRVPWGRQTLKED